MVCMIRCNVVALDTVIKLFDYSAVIHIDFSLAETRGGNLIQPAGHPIAKDNPTLYNG